MDPLKAKDNCPEARDDDKKRVTSRHSRAAVLVNSQWLRKCAQGLCDPWQDTVPEWKERGGDHERYTPSQGSMVN